MARNDALGNSRTQELPDAKPFPGPYNRTSRNKIPAPGSLLRRSLDA
jgi:hypothetical protein